ncbi:uncharacterized protein LOC120669319 [Panicum virgatum]|uniref:uncharacterized protein LOC120669319 n=1 Tax=Panicum virgatum TaxID=38727 RepID=UPI0019D5FF9E|nr:uncharacterized protein LOC120669319 [Panicum virgatum]
MDDIRDYLKEKFLPEDDATTECIARQSKRYAMVDGDLYQHDTDRVFLRCISQEVGGELLADIHKGECGSHSSSRTLVGKAFRHVFYWRTALQDAAELGLDILGPFPKAIGDYEWLYLAIDKFTKWPEATTVVKANKNSALKFINPNRIITDNGTQFTSNLKLCFASVAHPRSNQQVERANAEILEGIKTWTYNELKKHWSRWIDELPAVVWANRTTPNRATGEILFLLVYGSEVVLPAEVTPGSPRVRAYQEEDKDHGGNKMFSIWRKFDAERH